MGYHDRKLRWIITDFLDDLAKNKLSRIAKKTGLSLAEVNRYGSIIKSLNPCPGIWGVRKTGLYPAGYFDSFNEWSFRTILE
jgi:DNA-directed RNA polymerase specialized sigma54-like protein